MKIHRQSKIFIIIHYFTFKKLLKEEQTFGDSSFRSVLYPFQIEADCRISLAALTSDQIKKKSFATSPTLSYISQKLLMTSTSTNVFHKFWYNRVVEQGWSYVCPQGICVNHDNRKLTCEAGMNWQKWVEQAFIIPNEMQCLCLKWQ